MEVQLFPTQNVSFGNQQPSNVTVTLSNGTEVNFSTRVASTPSARVTPQLLEDLKVYGFPTKLDGRQYIPSLQISVGFGSSNGAESGFYQGYIEVLNMDNLIRDVFGDTATMETANIEMTLGTLYCNQSGQSIVPADPTHVLTLNSVSRRFSGESLKVGSAIPNYWYNYYGGNSWTSQLSMKLIVSRIVGPDPAVADHLAYARVMLTEEVCCDAIIVAKNGAEVNCHRSILAAHSEVFRTMFQVNMQEAQTGKVEMVDMAEASVRALLDYLYLWEIKAPQESSLVCFELREAGHKYRIDDLEKATEKILLRKDAPWYDAEVALRLYLFTRGLELEALRVKAVRVMKSKVGELKDLSAYKKLFKENVDIAIEISECFATIQ